MPVETTPSGLSSSVSLGELSLETTPCVFSPGLAYVKGPESNTLVASNESVRSAFSASGKSSIGASFSKFAYREVDRGLLGPFQSKFSINPSSINGMVGV